MTSCHVTVYFDSARAGTAVAWDPYNAWYGELHILIEMMTKGLSELRMLFESDWALVASIPNQDLDSLYLNWLGSGSSPSKVEMGKEKANARINVFPLLVLDADVVFVTAILALLPGAVIAETFRAVM